MIDFIENEIKPRIYNQLTKDYEKIAIVGHSLGGYLAQLFALSYHSLVDKVYTFNTPGVFNDKVKKLIDTIDNGAMSVISLLMCNITGIVGLSIYSLFQSKAKNLKAYEILQINDSESLYAGMIEINEEIFKRIISYQGNSRRLLTIVGNDNIANNLRHTVPYFLRTDQEEITLQKARDNKGIREVFYQASMQQEAKKLYDTIKTYKDTQNNQTFYVYYAYVFTHTATQAQIAESKIIIMDYNLQIPLNSLCLTA